MKIIIWCIGRLVTRPVLVLEDRILGQPVTGNEERFEALRAEIEDPNRGLSRQKGKDDPYTDENDSNEYELDKSMP